MKTNLKLFRWEKQHFINERNPFFYDTVLTMSRKRRSRGTSASRIILVSPTPTYSQKVKPKAQNQLGHFPHKLLMYSCGELNDEKSIYSESSMLQRLQHIKTFDLRMVSKRNLLVYIHLSVMLSVTLVINRYFFDALLFTVSTLNLFFSKLLDFTTYSNWQNDWNDFFFISNTIDY